MNGFEIVKHGSEYIAHVIGCDCLEDGVQHGTADHPVAALRRLLAAQEKGPNDGGE